MAYIGINDKARKVLVVYIGDENNKARKVVKGYVGDSNGIARLWLDNEEVITGDKPVLAQKWYKGNLKQQITKITLVDSYTPDDTVDFAWAADEADRGSIMCYQIGTEVIIAGNGSGGIYAPVDSTCLFGGHPYSSVENYNFSSLTTIEGLNLLDTSNTTNFTEMFYFAWELTELDLTGFDTRKAETYYSMFWACDKLRVIYVSRDTWKPATEEDEYTMYHRCIATDVTYVSNTISFTVNNNSYEADKGMTWEEWIDSDYDSGRMVVDGDRVYFREGGSTVGYSTNNPVSPNDVIEPNVAYVTFYE